MPAGIIKQGQAHTTLTSTYFMPIVCQFNSSLVFEKLDVLITQLAKMSIDPKFIELTADVFFKLEVSLKYCVIA